MSDTGWKSPGTVVDDDSVGTVAWSNPSNAKASDDYGAWATSASTTEVISHYLKATNFGFSIPTGATINGIELRIERNAINQGTFPNPPYARDNQIKLVKSDGSISTSNKADTSINWPSSQDTTVSYGGSLDLWGETWTPTDINSSSFGAVLAVALRATPSAPPCLEKNTKITTIIGQKKISDITLGEEIYSFNEKSGLVEKDTVVDVLSRDIHSAENKLYTIRLDDKNFIKATGNHLFYANKNWVAVKDLKPEDVLVDVNLDKRIIKSISVDNVYDEIVWDLSVSKNHNFFANNILVHNASGTAYVDHIQIKVYYTESSGTDTSSERGLYTKGKNTGSSERGLYTSGVGNDFSNRNIYSSGKSTGSSERGLYSKGAISGSSTRQVYTKGISTDGSSRNVYTRGTLGSFSQRGIYSKGISTNSSTRQIYTRGSVLDDSERGLYTKGISTSFSQRDIYSKGIATAGSERGIYSRGSIQTFSNRTLYTKGVNTNSSQRGIFSIGSIQGWSQRGLYTIGSDVGSSSRNIYLSGIDIKDSERSIYTRGQLASSSERPLYTWGSDQDSSERGLYVRGGIIASSERAIYTLGISGDSSERSLYTRGGSSDTSERAIYVTGCIPADSVRGLYTKGTWKPWVDKSVEYGTIYTNNDTTTTSEWVDKKASSANNFIRKV